MGTDIRPELSSKNKYWIERHRYYELKHFCLQYPIWKRAYTELDGYHRRSGSMIDAINDIRLSDPTERYVEDRLYFSDRMKLVEQAAIGSSIELASYILKAVTEGMSYDHLKTTYNIPCGKDVYYELYRRFFWILDKTRK